MIHTSSSGRSDSSSSDYKIQAALILIVAAPGPYVLTSSSRAGCVALVTLAFATFVALGFGAFVTLGFAVFVALGFAAFVFH